MKINETIRVFAMFRQASATSLIILLFISLSVSACGEQETSSQPEFVPAVQQMAASTHPTSTPSSQELTPAVRQPLKNTFTTTPEPTPRPTRTRMPLSQLQSMVTWEDAEMELRYVGWKTDFSKHSVPYSDIKRGGPPRDGITPVDDPKFETVAEASSYMEESEPVLSVEIEGEARAYPLDVLIWHEIVNDELAGAPISVTYCPLCNSAIVFDRRVDNDEKTLDFGTTGYLRHRDMIMWDRQTESWWQQIPGEAIVGEYTGVKLETIPAVLASWRDFENAYPGGSVLSRDTGFPRDYSRPPYAGYDSMDGRPFMFVGDLDDRLPPTERVVGVNVGGDVVAYPFTLLESYPVINDSVADTDIAIFYVPHTLSPFPGMFGSENPTVGSSGVFDPMVGGRKLTFRFDEGAILDERTNSSWSVLGEAIDGPLSGSRLAPVKHANHFWFAWRAFYPDTMIKIVDDFSD